LVSPFVSTTFPPASKEPAGGRRIAVSVIAGNYPEARNRAVALACLE
jgi:hypothetical protein